MVYAPLQYNLAILLTKEYGLKFLYNFFQSFQNLDCYQDTNIIPGYLWNLLSITLKYLLKKQYLLMV